MARIPAGVEQGDYPELQVVARTVLLDGLEALVEHSDAVTVIGAQALYLRSADVNLSVAAFTTDADLGLDPDRLQDSPLIEDAVTSAGFVLRSDQPGLWVTTRKVAGRPVDIGLDLMVAEAFAGRGGRSVQIPPHDKTVGRRAPGLEATAVDFDPMPITSLNPTEDPREIVANVAGPAALLVAKAYKLHERVAAGRAERIVDKDAGDVVRLMLGVDPTDTAARFDVLLADPRAGEVSANGLRLLRELFAGSRTPGTEMAVRALAGDRIASRVDPIASAYLEALPNPE